jgi:hypothetical protein
MVKVMRFFCGAFTYILPGRESFNFEDIDYNLVRDYRDNCMPCMPEGKQISKIYNVCFMYYFCGK